MEDQTGGTYIYWIQWQTTAWIKENPQQENDERNHHLWDNNPTKLEIKKTLDKQQREGKWTVSNQQHKYS